MKKVNVLVLFGGRSGEHEVSLSSARSVVDQLNPERYQVLQVGINHAGEWLWCEYSGRTLDEMQKGNSECLVPVVLLPYPAEGAVYAVRSSTLERIAQIDVVIPILHGTFGEDGCLQGFLELTDIPYVGAGVLGSALGMDKSVFKDVMRAHQIPVVESSLILRSEIHQDLPGVIAKLEQRLPYPVFVKPANLGSSVGITKCNSPSDLVEGLMEAARYDRRILVERGINAREIEVSVLGNENPQASVPGEVLPSREFYSYEAKYLDGTSGLLIPAPLTEEQTRLIQTMAVRVYQAIDCAGMARVDFLLDKDTGEIFLGEINTIPGFTEISMYPKLWKASGLDYAQLLDRLIELAFERKNERDRTEYRYRREV
jgi:D-alanine-D-alanine ligase